MVNCLIKIAAKKRWRYPLYCLENMLACILALVMLVVANIFINSSLFRNLIKWLNLVELVYENQPSKFEGL